MNTPRFFGTRGVFQLWVAEFNELVATTPNVSYGGQLLMKMFDAPTNATVYGAKLTELAAHHPTSTVVTGMDAALSGTVLMESGSTLKLGNNSTWARNITVGTAS